MEARLGQNPGIFQEASGLEGKKRDEQMLVHGRVVERSAAAS
jgi:hypothetical protein